MLNLFKTLFGFGRKSMPTPITIVPGMVDYLVNDSTTNIHVSVQLPEPPPYLTFSVQGFDGTPWTTQDRVKSQAGNVYVTLARSIQQVQNLLGQPITNWAATNCLSVLPRAGQMLNAYYDRTALQFFWENIHGRILYTADSTDITAHELGHALLDALRPDFWSVQALEIWAFHEAFADINAMNASMDQDVVLTRVIDETNGNLRLSNVVSKIAEEVGYALLGPGKCLRDGVNNFKYVNPETLPKETEYDQLASECHSFGRVFLGTWYELMVQVYEYDVAHGKAKVDALRDAKTLCHRWLLQAARQAPRVANYHDAVARVMLSLARNEGSIYADLMNSVFVARGILQPKLFACSVKHRDMLPTQPSQEFNLGNEVLAIVPERKTIKLNDHGTAIRAFAIEDGPDLGDVEIEVAADKFYLFDQQGNVLDSVEPTQDEIVSAARLCVGQIHSFEDVGSTHATMWEIDGNKLLRTFIE
jgi:hypothetical protein